MKFKTLFLISLLFVATTLAISQSVVTPTSGGVPGGLNTQVQYNNNGAFGGTVNFQVTSAANGTFLIGGGPGGGGAGAPSLTVTGATGAGNITIGSTNGSASTSFSIGGGAGTTTLQSSNATPAFLTLTAGAGFNSPAYQTATNCSSSASPAVCGSAASGSVVVAAAATTEVVNTTAVTANSQVLLTFDSSLGTKLAVTCNTTVVQPTVSARTGGTNFTITVPTAPTTNPACFSYTIIN